MWPETPNFFTVNLAEARKTALFDETRNLVEKAEKLREEKKPMSREHRGSPSEYCCLPHPHSEWLLDWRDGKLAFQKNELHYLLMI